MLLYHGSNVEVSNPQILESDRRLDFGKGFYLTSSYEQAKRWAELTVKRRETGKATVSVFVFDDTDPVGNAGLPRKAERRVQPRIRRADHQICVGRVLFRQYFSRFQTKLMHRKPVDHGIRTCKIDVFEHTQLLFLLSAMLPA